MIFSQFNPYRWFFKAANYVSNFMTFNTFRALNWARTPPSDDTNSIISASIINENMNSSLLLLTLVPYISFANETIYTLLAIGTGVYVVWKISELKKDKAEAPAVKVESEADENQKDNIIMIQQEYILSQSQKIEDMRKEHDANIGLIESLYARNQKQKVEIEEQNDTILFLYKYKNHTENTVLKELHAKIQSDIYEISNLKEKLQNVELKNMELHRHIMALEKEDSKEYFFIQPDDFDSLSMQIEKLTLSKRPYSGPWG